MSERFEKYEKLSTSIAKNNLYNPESSDEDNDDNYNILPKNQFDNKFKNFRSQFRESFIKDDEKINRVKQLTEKLSNVQIEDLNKYPNKLNKVETKFEAVEDNFQHTYDNLNSKYNTLKDHIAGMKKRLEEEIDNKEDMRKNIGFRLNNIQGKIRSMLLEEKEHFKFYTDNICAKLEAELIKTENELKRDDEVLMKNINEIKENIKVRKTKIFILNSLIVIIYINSLCKFF